MKIDEIKYPTALDAFKDGDYSYVARNADNDKLLKGAAFVLLGNNEDGLSILKDIDTPESLYYKAFGLWGINRKEEALENIGRCIKTPRQDKVLLEKAERLKRFINQGKIRVLTQARNDPGTAYYNIIREMKKSRQFEVINIGFHANDDIQLKPYESLESVLRRLPKGWMPDFYFCHQVEYNLLPIGIENAPFPIIGYTGDYDLHIHTCYHHLRFFDAVVVSGSVDHYEVSRGIGIDSFTFSKVFGIEMDVFRTAVDNKDIDIFFSGMAFHPYHDDKAVLLNRLSQLSDKYKVCILNHFINEEEYATSVARSKMTFTYVRRYGAIPSRGIEALRRGTVALYQEDGEMGLFFSEDEGAVPYREDNLEEVVEKVLIQWDNRYKESALRGMKKVMQTFDFEVCMARYLKFLTLISSDIDITKRVHQKSERDIARVLRYPPLLKGGIQTTHPLLVTLKAHKRNIENLKMALKNEDNVYGYNILGLSNALIFFSQKEFYRRNRLLPPVKTIIRLLKEREFSTLFFVVYLNYLPSNNKKFLEMAIKTLEDGRTKFPFNLSILFNLGRLCYHGGYYKKANEIFGNILSMENFQYEPLDNLYPYDFFPTYFPYRGYIDILMRYLITKDERLIQEMLNIIISSAWYYSGCIDFETNKIKETVVSCENSLKYYSNFSFTHLLYAKALSSMDDINSMEKVISHLKIAFDISPSLIHPDITLLVSAFERLGGDRNNAEIFQYIDRWLRYVKAQPDISLKESEIELANKYKKMKEKIYENTI